jgi:hypothetical protein
MKYEFTFSSAVFPAPKVYGGVKITNEGPTQEMVKIKGVKNQFLSLHSVLFFITTRK